MITLELKAKQLYEMMKLHPYFREIDFIKFISIANNAMNDKVKKIPEIEEHQPGRVITKFNMASIKPLTTLDKLDTLTKDYPPISDIRDPKIRYLLLTIGQYKLYSLLKSKSLNNKYSLVNYVGNTVEPINEYFRIYLSIEKNALFIENSLLETIIKLDFNSTSIALYEVALGLKFSIEPFLEENITSLNLETFIQFITGELLQISGEIGFNLDFDITIITPYELEHEFSTSLVLYENIYQMEEEIIDTLTTYLRILAAGVPSAPTAITVSAITTNQINISWNVSQDATGYRVYRNTAPTGTFTHIASVTDTNYTDTSVNSETTYYYKITAYNDEGEGSYSSTGNATTPAQSTT